jgi:hypothetical protein
LVKDLLSVGRKGNKDVKKGFNKTITVTLDFHRKNVVIKELILFQKIKADLFIRAMCALLTIVFTFCTLQYEYSC